jgi:hypothetical protein
MKVRLAVAVSLLAFCPSSFHATAAPATATSTALSTAPTTPSDQPLPSPNGSKPATPGFSASYSKQPLSFEPNRGQSGPQVKFLSRGRGYSLSLTDAAAVLTLARSAPAAGKSAQKLAEEPKAAAGRSPSPPAGAAETDVLRMELVGAARDLQVSGEDQLPGKVSYFPSIDRKSWLANIPTYARVRYSSLYPGVDAAFYGNANRLEYDFMLAAKADPGQIRMRLAGADEARIDKDGTLALRVGKQEIRFLAPLAYQAAADGKTREAVAAAYRLERAAKDAPPTISFSLGRYDRSRPLVIDPVVALSYAEFLNGYAADVTVDASGNTYVTGQDENTGFDVTEYNPAGTQIYNAVVGTGYYLYPQRVRVDGSGNAYVAGYTYYNSATLPTGSNSYQSANPGDRYNAFLVQVAAGGASVPYATYLGASDSTDGSLAYGLGVETVSGVTYAYIAGGTYSPTFPVTAGVYQSAFSGTDYNGFVAKFNPAASGSASLVYSTLLGQSNSALYALAVDAAGDAYVTGYASWNFPITSGAFEYNGDYSGNGGVYVAKLNPTGTALVYSAYLGYGTGNGIAVDSGSNAYVTGQVSYEDFPTTSGAYQTYYPGGFVTELNPAGSAEIYSTFLGGPSSINESNVVPSGIALENGCTTPCNAYVSGWTNTADFPAINAIQAAPSSASNYSAFVVELASNGASALLSTYLSGINGGVYLDEGTSYGFTPAIAVDSSGNMSVVGNLYSTPDFPVTIANSNPSQAFLAKIVPTATAPFTWSTPPSISFSSQPVGVSTSLSGGTQTVTVRNISSTPVTISSVLASPSSIFSESDSCAGTIAAAGICVLNLNFDPGATGTRTGTVTVTSNASDSPLVIPVTGTGYDTDYTVASAASLSFGSLSVGGASAPQQVTLTNIGNETATLNIYYYYYLLGTSFYADDNCPTQLAPGASCVAEVTFAPTQAGLNTGTLYITGGGGPTIYIPLSGTGLPAGATGAVTFSSPTLQFGSEGVGQTTSYQSVHLENNSSVPFTVTGITVSGDFSIYTNQCGTTPFELAPESSCYVSVTFTPSAGGARAGSLTFADSAAGSPQSVALSGTGVAATQTLEFYPSPGVTFGDDVPVGTQSGTITVYAQNAGTTPITIDRAKASGDFLISYDGCSGTTLAGTTEDGSGSLAYCIVYVIFQPTATGQRTGSLTFVDSAGNSPQALALSGNAIADTGTAAVTPTQLVFGTQAVGTSSAVQYVTIENPGDSPVTIDGYATGTGSFSVTNYGCSAPPFVLTAGNSCQVQVQFTPASTGALTDTLTVTGSIGNATVSLSGTGVAESKTIGFTPASPMNSGSVVEGQSSGAGGRSENYQGDLVSIRNTGTATVTFSANPAIGGTNAADFSLNNYDPYYGYCGNSGNQLAPGASCVMWITFTPSIVGAETATLTLTDDATGATQVLTLEGTGVATAPKYALSNNLLNFDNQVKGTTSPENTYLYFYNNSTSAVTLGNVAIGAGFLTPSDNCSGQVIPAHGGSCYVYVSFAPTSAGLITGTITFKNSGGTTLVSAPLSGYAPAPAVSAILTPTTLNFLPGQPVTSTSPSMSTVLTNTGNLPLTVGTVTGTNLGAAPADEFSLGDQCGSATLAAGSSCREYVTFTPNAVGARTGSLKIPVTYNNGTTATFTANFTGTGIAEVNSAVLQPGNGNFADQTVGVQSSQLTLYLVNQGNLPFKVGTLTGTNAAVGVTTTGEFSAQSAQGGYDSCSGASVSANTGACYMSFTFTPSATGTRSGSVNFPVTFADGTTKTVTATLTGKGVAAAPALLFSPVSLEFQPEIIHNTSNQSYVGVTNVGNTSVTFGSASTLSAGFVLGSNGDGCFSAGTLAVRGSCNIWVSFAPTATGNITGTLTVNDNAGGPHKLPLSGTAIAASQQIVLSQTALAFGNQPQGSSSSPQLVYVTNQSDSAIASITATLGGTNAADYTLSNGCASGLNARASCTLTITFNPATTATGTRTASVTLTDSDPGSPRAITLTGTAVPPGPAVALTPPSPLSFPSQSAGTSSGVENFSVTNTGSANLTVTGVALGGANAGDFAIVADGCSGAVLAANQNCVVGLRFAPAVAGAKAATASVTDNATGSPQSIGITGTASGLPIASLSTSSLTFANTLVGSTSPKQSVTLSNTGTATLQIASITLTGQEADDFSPLVTTCGATLAPGASCTISTTFAAIFSGNKFADIAIVDNANNVAGSTQTVSIFGIGVADPTTTTLATSVNPSTSGQPVTFSATVVASTGVTPNGTVTFFNGAATLGTESLVGGVATLTTTALPVGYSAITASYVYVAGQKDAASTSAPLVQVVNPSPTTTSLSSSLNPATAGASVIFTATVAATTGATPTGTVTFLNGTAILGTGTLNGSGAATLTTTALPAGSDSITASYGGSATDAASASSPLTEVVNN